MNAKEFMNEWKKNDNFRMSTDTVSDQTLIDFANGYAEYKLKESAAPDMLEALEAMLSRFKGCDIGMIKSNHVKAQAEAAIAKAKLKTTWELLKEKY